MQITYQLISSIYDTSTETSTYVWNYLVVGVPLPGLYFTGTESQLKTYLQSQNQTTLTANTMASHK